jgi:carbamoyltransferase
MLILGLNDSNSAAAVVRDGILLAAAREERFNRIKHSDAFPRGAAEYCLKTAGAEIRDVDHVVFAWNPGHEIEPLDDMSSVRQHRQFLHYVPNNLLALVKGHKRNKKIDSISQVFRIPGKDLNIHFLPHHASHAAGCFFTSPFDDALILTVDAYGDDTSMEMFHGSSNRVRSISRTLYPHSLGSVYAAVTQYLGFRPNVDEWKVMGLAPYGEPEFYDRFRKIIRFEPSLGEVRIDLDYFTYYIWASRRFSDAFEKTFGPERGYADPIETRHQNIAHSFQKAVEDVVLEAVEFGLRKTGSRLLCLSGGCAMNSKMNGRILSEAKVDDLFVQSSADDGGACLGACFYFWNGVLNKPRGFVYEHDYWGPEYEDGEIELALKDAKIEYRRSSDIAREAAESIVQGKIVGWFQGRMEYGQRALGNRSILADPRDPGMKDKINACVKHREGFRPFAPSILEEYQGDFFEILHPAPFMQKIYPIREEKRALVPAVTHVDGSGRLQTVARRHNPLYWNLIDRFREMTGVPLVLNTSFNDNDEPIVTTPKHALRCFFGTGIDVLCMGSFMVRK